YAEMSAFFHGLVRRTRIILTPQQKAEVIDELVKRFPGLSPKEREEISQADILWGLVRYNWRDASRDERERVRQELMKVANAQKPPSEHAPVEAAPETAQSEAPLESAPVEAAKSEEPPVAQTDAESPQPSKIEAKELAHNSKFIEAIRKLRMSAAKTSPFQF